MNLYEFLANQFNNELGAKYLISYNNNLETDWDAILTDDICHGVLQIQNGQTGNVLGCVVETKGAILNIAIPLKSTQEETNDILNEEIANIEHVFSQYQRDITKKFVDFEDTTVQIGYNYRADADILGTFKGITYALVSVYLTFLITDSVLYASEVSVTVGGSALGGVISWSSSINKEFDGSVQLNSSGVNAKKCIPNNYGLSYKIDVVVLKNDLTVANLLLYKKSNTLYTLAINYGITFSENSTATVTESESVYLQNLTIMGITADSVKASLIFVGPGYSIT